MKKSKKKSKEESSEPKRPTSMQLAYIGNRPYTELNGRKVKRHTVITVPTKAYDDLVNTVHWMDGAEFDKWIVKYKQRKAKREALKAEGDEK